MAIETNLCLDEGIEEDVDVNPYQSPLGMSEDVEDCGLSGLDRLGHLMVFKTTNYIFPDEAFDRLKRFVTIETPGIAFLAVFTEYYFQPIQRFVDYIF